MAIAKIILNGVVQMDVTQDTVATNNLLSGETATGADGEQVIGAYVPAGGDTYTRTEILPSQSFTPGSDRRATLSGMTGFVDGGYYIVTYDGVEWLTTCDLLWSVDYCIGEVQWLFGTPDSACPFCVVWESGTVATVAIGNTSQHTIKIERLEFVDGPLNLIAKSVTANGTYNASSDNADGYSSVTVNVSGGGGGGLVYETGTYTPTEDIIRPTITFANTHTEPPFFAFIADATNVYDDTTSTVYQDFIVDWYRFTGNGVYASSSSLNYSINIGRYRNGATSFTNATTVQTYSSDVTVDGTNAYPRYYISETYFKPRASTSSYYFRVGHTYKWIAVWKPTA